MIQNHLFRERIAAIPEERKAEFDLSFAIAECIDEVLRRKGIEPSMAAENTPLYAK